MLHDEHEADDVAQEVFERVFQNLTRFRGDSSLATWLRRIVVNRCLNRLGQRGRLVPLDQVEGELRAADDRPGERERAADLSLGLARLEPAERALVVMASQEGSSYEELGRAFKANRDEIRGRLYRARRKLKELLGW